MRHSELDHNRVIEMYVDEKRSAFKIADAFGVLPSKIYEILKKHNVPRRSRRDAQLLREYPTSITDENLKDAIIRLYCGEALSLKKVGKRLGISGTQVRKIMIYWGIPRRNPSEGMKKWETLPADEIVRLYVEEECSGIEISLRFKVSTPIIGQVLKYNGVRLRTTAEAKALWYKRRREQQQAKPKPVETQTDVLPDVSIEEQIVSMRRDQNAKIQDIAHTLKRQTVEVFDVLKAAGVL